MLLRNLANFLKRLDGAIFVIDVHDGYQHRRLANGIAELLQANPSIPVYREIRHFKPALLKVVARMQHGVMFYRRGDDMVALAAALFEFCQSLDGVVIRLRAAAGKHDFAWTFRTDERGDLFASGINGVTRLTSVGMNAGAVAECLSEIRHHGIPHFGMERRGGVVI